MKSIFILVSLLSIVCVHSYNLNTEGLSSAEIDALDARVQELIGATTCGSGTTQLSGFPSATDLKGQDQGTVYTYYMNPCGTANNAACKTNRADAMVCQVGNVNQVYSLGNWQGGAGVTWASVTNGVTATMTNGDQCYNNNQPVVRQTIVTFTCGVLGPMTVVAPPNANPCDFTVAVTVPCGGGGGSSGGPGPNPIIDIEIHKKGGLSGGSIFLIIFFCCIPVYILVGCLYNWKGRGMTGVGACPQYDFWKDCPFLVKDGFVFTYQKARGLCTGGSTKDHFETIPE